MTETLDTQSDTMELINQDHPITTRKELAQAIKDLKTKFKQDNVKPKPVIIINPDEPKKSKRGRPSICYLNQMLLKLKGLKGDLGCQMKIRK